MAKSLSEQAKSWLWSIAKIGESRHELSSKDGPHITSIRALNNSAYALANAAKWAGVDRIKHMTPELAREYLNHRKDFLNPQGRHLSQKTLDLDRIALQLSPSIASSEIDRVMLEQEEREPELNIEQDTFVPLCEQSRAYTPEQIREIAEHQNDRNGLATLIAANAGLRAHELLTLQRGDESNGPSNTRTWSDERFQGRDGVLYTTKGKNGLVREVMISRHLSDRLEERRLDEPKDVTDRGVHYSQIYNVAGGQAWSSSFGRASERIYGWSNGAHGVRHTYAQERLGELQDKEKTFNKSREVTSQELGHFRPGITETYLR